MMLDSLEPKLEELTLEELIERCRAGKRYISSPLPRLFEACTY